MDRLFEGAASIALDIGLDRQGVEQALWQTLERNGMKDGAHMRLMITRGTKKTPAYRFASSTCSRSAMTSSRDSCAS